MCYFYSIRQCTLLLCRTVSPVLCCTVYSVTMSDCGHWYFIGFCHLYSVGLCTMVNCLMCHCYFIKQCTLLDCVTSTLSDFVNFTLLECIIRTLSKYLSGILSDCGFYISQYISRIYTTFVILKVIQCTDTKFTTLKTRHINKDTYVIW